MRNSFIVLALCSIFAFIGCDKKVEMPSRDTLDKVFSKKLDAEIISPDSLCIIMRFANSTVFPECFGLDIRSDEEIEASLSNKYDGCLSAYEFYVSNDSIINVIRFDPVVEKLIETNRDTLIFYNRQYTFHRNGDVEIKIGNDLDEEYDPSNYGVFKYAYIDGTTGLVVRSYVNNGSLKLNYRITSKGEIEVGHDYGDYENSAMYMFDLLKKDMHLALVTYSKGRS